MLIFGILFYVCKNSGSFEGGEKEIEVEERKVDNHVDENDNATERKGALKITSSVDEER